MGKKPKGSADARAMPEVHQNIRVFMRVIQNRIPKGGVKIEGEARGPSKFV